VDTEERHVDEGRPARNKAASSGAAVAGQNDAAMTYEPYLSWSEQAQAGKIATTLDYPMVMDTFGCTPKFIKKSEGGQGDGR
jgi:hypothetical protein